MLCGAKHLILARLYSGTPLHESKKFGHINRVAILSGQAQIPWLEPGPYNDKYPVHRIRISLTTAVINKQSECRYRVQWLKKLLKIFLQYTKHC